VFDRSILSVGFAVFLSCLLGPGTALATVKCQCNNGMVVEAVDADYDDDDVADSCSDACDGFGGGRVWNLETDDDDTDVTVNGGERHHRKPERRER